jgi:chromosome partitioning protein
MHPADTVRTSAPGYRREALRPRDPEEAFGVVATENPRHPIDTPRVLPAELRPPAGTRVAVYMQKGGTGKTETSKGLAEALARFGVPVAAVDLDPHGALTAGLGLDLVSAEANLANLLTGRYRGSITDCLVQRAENLVVVPSNVDMALVEQDLSSVRFREERLRQVLQPLLDRYVVILDCPNNPGLLNDNALIAVADEDGAGGPPGGLLMVVQLEGSSLHSLELLLDQVDTLNSATRYTVALLGWFANLVDDTKLAKRTRASLEATPLAQLGEMRRRATIKYAWEAGRLVSEYDPCSDALHVYRFLAWNLAQRLGGRG